MKTQMRTALKMLLMSLCATVALSSLATASEVKNFEIEILASGGTIKILGELEDYPSQIQLRGQGADGMNRIPIVAEPLEGGKFIGFLATQETADRLCQLAGYVAGRVDTIGTQIDVPMNPLLPINWWQLNRKAGVQYSVAQKAFEVVPHTQGGYLSIAKCCRTSECLSEGE